MKSVIISISVAMVLFWPVQTLQQDVQSMQELNKSCLTANIFFEARGESDKGKKAVAEVTVNRALSELYPEGVCNVVFQRKQFSWTHQQNWGTIDAVLKGKLLAFEQKDKLSYRSSYRIAEAYLQKPFPVLLNRNSLFYHNKKIKPVWSHKMKKTSTIGNHVFY